MTQFISTVLIRCPHCERQIEGPKDKPIGIYNGRCRKCAGIFTYQVSFVSPSIVSKPKFPAPRLEPEHNTGPVTLLKTKCGVCGSRQRKTPSGITCANGHGGAKPVADLDSSDSGTDWQTAIEQCNRILGMCEEMPDAGYDFAQSVHEKTEDIATWIETHKSVTGKMQEALDNMESGLSNWLNQ